MTKDVSDKKPTSRDLRKEIETAKSDVGTFNPVKELGETRSRIAKHFVLGYFLMIGGAFVLTLIYNLILYTFFQKIAAEQILPPKDILLTVTGIVGSPLGFIVGYYFKDIQK